MIIHRTYTADAEEQDLIRAGADQKMEVFYAQKQKTLKYSKKLQHILAWKNIQLSSNQKLDKCYTGILITLQDVKNVVIQFTEIEADKNPELMRRFVIMLDDWKHGQVFALGNSNWHQWKRGECITWEWRDIPHATCNMGWENRPMLQVTGWTTQTTHDIVAKGEKNH